MPSFWQRHAPLLLTLAISGLALAADLSGTGRLFPYAGFLEESGQAVTGTRDLKLDLFTSETGGTACDSQTFDDVDVVGGRFAVNLEDPGDTCLAAGELFVAVSVGQPGDTLTLLSSGPPGGRMRIGAVPFATAAPKSSSLLIGTGDVRFLDTESNARYILSGSDTASPDVGIALRAETNPASGEALFRVLSQGGAERLRVEHDGAVSVDNDFSTTGDLSADGNLDIDGTASIASTVDIDNGTLRTVNTTGLTIFTDTGNAGANTGQALKVVANRGTITSGRLEPLTLTQDGDLTLTGAVVSACPANMTRIGDSCIDNDLTPRSGASTWDSATLDCHNQGKHLCSYAELMACDSLNPGTSDCTDETGGTGNTLHTSNRTFDAAAFPNNTNAGNLIGFRRGSSTLMPVGVSADYFCCVHGVFTGTP